jgi:DNA invertase Pin-like site-specific DNA recombinase
MPALRAAFYFRMSTDRQEDSIDRQKAAVLPYAVRQGYEPAGEPYVDEGVAGDVFDKRPGFQRLLRDAAAGRFDVIVVDEPSRLSRQNPIDLIEKVIAPLRRSKVKLDTASKGPLDYESLAGLIMMTVHASKAEDETHDLSRRVLGGIARKAKAGAWFGWAPPYGLRMVRETDPTTAKVIARRCVLGPEEEVRAVRFVFDAVANRGWLLRQVCRELERRGIKPPTTGRGANKAEGRWNPGTVRRILLNRKYVGDLPWNETHVGKFHAWRGGHDGEAAPEPYGGTVRRTRNAAADVVVVAAPDLIPPIIDRDTFARAAAAMARAQKRTAPGGKAASYLFTHVLVCGDCGSFLRGQPDHGKKGYICAKYKEYGSGACSRNTVSEELLRGAIIAALLDDVLSPARLDAVEAEMERRLKAERSSGEAERLRRQVGALDRDIARGNANLARLPEDRLPGVIAQVRQWEGERAGLAARLAELDSGGAESKAVLAEAREQLWKLRESLQDGDEEVQATVIREVVSKAEVRFTHEKTGGGRSPTGQGRTLHRPTGLVLYVLPGLGFETFPVDYPGLPASGSRRCIIPCQ